MSSSTSSTATAPPEQSVLIIQHSERVPPGYVLRFLHDAQLPYKIIHIYKDEALPPPSQRWRAIVILGGPQASYEDDMYVYLRAEKAWLSSLAPQQPVLGICLGCQIMAAVAGGVVTRAPSFEVGYPLIRLTSAGQTDAFAALWRHAVSLPSRFVSDANPKELPHVPFLEHHGDTFTLPDSCTLLATTQYNQMWTRGRWRAVQFHPEANVHEMNMWSHDASSRYGAVGRSSADVLQQVVDNTHEAEHASKLFFQTWWNEIISWEQQDQANAQAQS